MHWYKLETHYGPGHQSTHIRYVFFKNVPSQETLDDIREEECERFARTQARTTIEPVDTIPQEAIRSMRDKALRYIEDATRKLRALEELEKE